MQPSQAESVTTEQPTPTSAPRIGQPWPGQGGIYAGIVRGADGEPAYHLIIGIGAEVKDRTWNEAMAWATAIEIDGHTDFTLPRRADQSIAYGNARELFESEWYWSCEQPAADSDYAWFQGFGDGLQDLWLKFLHCRARAVRRLPI